MKNPVLLLHGALGSKVQLIPLQKNLASERKVFTMDFEGHGNSKSETDFSIELFTKNVIDFLRENSLPQVDIFGYSMGGYVALNVAFRNPDLVARIVTLGTKFEWTPAFAEKETKMLVPEKIEIKVPAFAERLKQLHGAENWENTVLKTARMMQNLGDNPTLKEEDFQKINNKTLICLGELDVMATENESKNVSSLLKNGRFQAIPKLKHPIETASMEEIAAIVRGFLN